MSHGNEKGEVIFSNGKLLKKDRIVAQFSSKYCEELYKKPKILYSKPVEAKQDEYDGDTFDKKLVANMNNKQVSNFW